MREVRLIVCDLDGTILGPVSEYSLYGHFGELINDFRRRHNAVWVVCTGRSMKSFRKVFSPFKALDIRPDFIIVEHAHIYSATGFGYMAHWLWNIRIRFAAWRSRRVVKKALTELGQKVRPRFHKVRSVSVGSESMRVRCQDGATCVEVAEFMRKEISRHRNLNVFEQLLEVEVRSVPFTKGIAIGEVARHLEVGSEAIMTIGDGHNDISMLNPGIACMSGCPMNAEPEVMEAVRVMAGHIASKPVLAGTVEVLEAYRDGEVSSELPEGWEHPALTTAYSDRKLRKRSRGVKMPWRSIAIFVAAVYVSLMALSKFGILPGAVGGIITKPLNVIIELIWPSASEPPLPST